MKVSDGTRTHDRLDHNQELYQLSYAHHGVQNLPANWPDARAASGTACDRPAGALQAVPEPAGQDFCLITVPDGEITYQKPPLLSIPSPVELPGVGSST